MDVDANSAEWMEENVEEALLEHQFLFAALHKAAANRHLGIVEYLIGKGVLTGCLDYGFQKHIIIKGNEVIKKLVLAGANVSTLNSHEWTPIDKALSRGKMEVIDAINAAMTELELAGASVS